MADGARCPSGETLTGQLTDVHGTSVVQLPDIITKGESVVLANHDRAVVGGHVVYQSRPETNPSESLPQEPDLCIGRVVEILIDAAGGEFLGMLIRPCNIGDVVLPYCMPSCRVHPDELQFLIKVIANTLKHVFLPLIDIPRIYAQVLIPITTAQHMTANSHIAVSWSKNALRHSDMTKNLSTWRILMIVFSIWPSFAVQVFYLRSTTTAFAIRGHTGHATS